MFAMRRTLLLFAVLLTACGGGVPRSSDTIKVAKVPEAPAMKKTEADPHKLRPDDRSKLPRIAIWPFNSSERPDIAVIGRWFVLTAAAPATDNEAAIATSAVATELTSQTVRRYEVLDRTSFSERLAEHGDEIEGLGGAAALVRVGELVGAHHIIVGSCIGTSNKDVVVEMRLFDVAAKGRLAASVTDVCRACDGSQLIAVSRRLARQLLGAQVPGHLGTELPGSE